MLTNDEQILLKILIGYSPNIEAHFVGQHSFYPGNPGNGIFGPVVVIVDRRARILRQFKVVATGRIKPRKEQHFFALLIYPILQQSRIMSHCVSDSVTHLGPHFC